MNCRLLSNEQRTELRARRDRRRYLRKQRKRREALVTATLAGDGLSLLESGQVTPEEAFSVLYDTMKTVRRALRAIEIKRELLFRELNPISFRCEHLAIPRRVLRRTNRGAPEDISSFCRRYVVGLHAAQALRERRLLPAEAVGTVYVDYAEISLLIPGIRPPMKVTRLGYLIRLSASPNSESSLVDVYSTGLTPLFVVPLALRWEPLIQELEKVGAVSVG